MLTLPSVKLQQNLQNFLSCFNTYFLSTYLSLVGIPGWISAQGWGSGQSTGRNVLATSTVRSAFVSLQLTGSGGESMVRLTFASLKYVWKYWYHDLWLICLGLSWDPPSVHPQLLCRTMELVFANPPMCLRWDRPSRHYLASELERQTRALKISFWDTSRGLT